MAAVSLGGDAYERLVAAERANAEKPPANPPRFDQLKKSWLIGSGGYSLVWLVSDGCQRYALKQMRKAHLVRDEMLGPELCYREKRAYEEIKPHPFIAHCYGTAQDPANLYLLLELCPMDMYSLVEVCADDKRRLCADWVRFYGASVGTPLLRASHPSSGVAL